MTENKEFPFEYSRPSDTRQVSLVNLMTTSGDRSALLEEAGSPAAPTERLWPTAAIAPPVPDAPKAVFVHALENCDIYGPNLLMRKRQLVMPEDSEPVYVARYLHKGWIHDTSGHVNYTESAQRKSIPTAFFVSHFNQNVYGHFLLEIVPKLFHIERLRQIGYDFPIILSTQAKPFIVEIVKSICPGITIVLFDPSVEICHLDTCLVISNCHTTSYNLCNRTISDFRSFALASRLANRKVPCARRIFLCRDDPKSYRYMTNGNAVKEVCFENGFVPVNPTDYTWAEQAAIFESANLIVGEFSSALHNSVFSQPDSVIIALNCIGTLQEGICGSAMQRIGYVLPTDGKPRVYIPTDRSRQDFAIDLGEFKQRLRSIIPFD